LGHSRIVISFPAHTRTRNILERKPRPR